MVLNELEIKKVVEKIFKYMLLEINNFGQQINERYLHHYFSNRIQTEYKNQFLKNQESIFLHPEWPTYKKSTGLSFSKYQKIDKKYYLKSDNGSSGFIDFCIGNYNNPFIGIEFFSKFGMDKEEIAFDFLKLLDQDNPFKYIYSLSFIFRKDKLNKSGRKKIFLDKLMEVQDLTYKRLGLSYENIKRVFLFVIIEISKDNSRRFFYINNSLITFKEGLPL